MMIGGGGVGGDHSTFSQQLEANTERLLVSFPAKDKLQLMKLLEELDNRVEVVHDILSSELAQTRNIIEEYSLNSTNMQ